ncbi:MAG TPA: hypothetical protein VGA55_09370 [Bacteroidota bacterium]
MKNAPCRPPRFSVMILAASITLLSCVPSTVRRADEIRSSIMENLFSTERLAFGADPRSVNAVRKATNAEDIPSLILLLGDSSQTVARVAKYVLVGYDETAVPYLNRAIAENAPVTPAARETLELIRKRSPD